MRSAPPRVLVLLPTFNGNRFIAAQLDSVLAQRNVEIEVEVRDDGSSDNTYPLVEDYLRRGDRVGLYRGPNLGPAGSFFELLARADAANGFVALCDQDDVWLPDKLERASARLGSPHESRPRMYCSRYLAVDSELKPLFESPSLRLAPRFGNALLENIAIGCSIVINRALLDVLRLAMPDPRRVVMHDWWIYLVASAFGDVVFDDHASLLYRQHQRNALGVKRGIDSWRGRWRRYAARGGQHLLVDQAQELMRCHGARLPDEPRELLDRFIRDVRSNRIARRVQLAVEPRLCRQKRLDELVLRAMIASGRL